MVSLGNSRTEQLSLPREYLNKLLDITISSLVIFV